MPTVSVSQRADALLTDIADRNDAPCEKEFARHWFDPMHGLTELRYAGKRRLIKIVESGSIPERFRFHLTPGGRAAAAAWALEGESLDLSDKQTKLRELLGDLVFENPEPTEAWIDAASFDPPHGLSEIHYAIKRSWIEIQGLVDQPAELRFRLTGPGRIRLARPSKNRGTTKAES